MNRRTLFQTILLAPLAAFWHKLPKREVKKKLDFDALFSPERRYYLIEEDALPDGRIRRLYRSS